MVTGKSEPAPTDCAVRPPRSRSKPLACASLDVALDVAERRADLATALFGLAFHFQVFVVRCLANGFLDFARHRIGTPLDLIFVHASSPCCIGRSRYSS